LGFQTINLALCENIDLAGIPTVKDGVTIYNPPAILPSSGKGLLNLEEINRADRSVLSCALLLLTLRKLNSYSLPTGWIPVASANPSEAGFDVNDLDFALLSRFMKVSVQSDAQEWLRWADANDVHQSVCRYVRATPNIFDGAESNPRAWTYVSNLLKTFERNGYTDEQLLLNGVSGLVGSSLGVAFTTFCLRALEPLSADMILREYDQHRQTVATWAKEKRTDLLNASAHDLLVKMQGSDLCAEIAKSDAMRKALAEFARTVPGDIGKKIKAAMKKTGAMA
jgi:hypothetical protein